MRETLEFSNLPLARVEMFILFGNNITPTLSELWEMQGSLKSDLPIVTEFMGGSGPSLSPFSINFGSGPGATFLSRDLSLGVQLRQDRLTAFWQKTDSGKPYPRFKGLKTLLLKAWNKKVQPVATTITYVNQIPEEHGEPNELLTSDIFPSSAGASKLFHELNISYRLADDCDFRLQVARTRNSFMLTTTGGISLDDLQVQEALDKVHSALIGEFSAKITDRAKEVWKLASS